MNKYWYEGFEFISVSSVGQSRETFTMKSSVDFQSICLLNGISSLLLLYFNCNIFSASSGHNVHHHNCQFSLALVCSLCGFNDDIYVSVQPLCCWRILGFFFNILPDKYFVSVSWGFVAVVSLSSWDISTRTYSWNSCTLRKVCLGFSFVNQRETGFVSLFLVHNSLLHAVPLFSTIPCSVVSINEDSTSE